MKKLLITAAIAVVVCVQTNAQGTVNFVNRITGTLDVPVFTDATRTTRLAGPDFVAQLYFSATGAAGSYAPVTAAAAPFRTGAGAGYWNAGADATRTLTGIAGGASVWLQVRVWNSTLGTYDAVFATGQNYGLSDAFQVTAGGGGTPPSVPVNLVGMTSFNVVPEPATIALGVLGLAGLLFIRRRK